jgi:hypothetical protein
MTGYCSLRSDGPVYANQAVKASEIYFFFRFNILNEEWIFTVDEV